MPDYRCYVLGSDNKIVAVQTATYPDDNAAVVWAESVLADSPQASGVELWSFARLVHRQLRTGG